MNKSILWKKWLYPEETWENFFEYFYRTREIKDEDFFLNWEYPKWLIHENHLPDIEKAVKRIKNAIEKKERIIVFWDYDCDWIPWTAICVDSLKQLWAEVSYRIPHRENDWYWLKNYFLDEFKEKNVKLVITVDNWINAIEEAKYAKKLWIDLVITDHHSIQDWLIPEAIAVVNPQREEYKKFKEICWAVVWWKVMIALAKEIKWEEWANENIRDKHIELAGLSTVTDIMQLKSENRIIVKEWISRIQKTKNEWLLALFEEMGHDLKKDIGSEFFWFQLWPRINASWRMNHWHIWVQLLLWNKNHAKPLEKLNNKRKKIVETALKELENHHFENQVVIIKNKDWTSWIIWLIAWKIQEKFGLPVIALQERENELVGSCRAPEWFNMFEFLTEFKDLFLHFWGHAQACWLTIKKDNFEKFKKKADIKSLEIMNENPIENLFNIDFEINHNELNLELGEKIKKLQPFWKWNRSPIFVLKNTKVKAFLVWKEKEHLSLSFSWNRAIGFFLWAHHQKIRNSETIDLAFTISTQVWKWKNQLHLRIIDIKVK